MFCATVPYFSAASTAKAAQRIGGYLSVLNTSNTLFGEPGIQPFLTYFATAPERTNGADIGNYLLTVGSNTAFASSTTQLLSHTWLKCPPMYPPPLSTPVMKDLIDSVSVFNFLP